MISQMEALPLSPVHYSLFTIRSFLLFPGIRLPF